MPPGRFRPARAWNSSKARPKKNASPSSRSHGRIAREAILSRFPGNPADGAAPDRAVPAAPNVRRRNQGQPRRSAQPVPRIESSAPGVWNAPQSDAPARNNAGTVMARPAKICCSARPTLSVRHRYHCSPPWNSGARVFRRIDRHRVLRKPAAGGDGGGIGQLGRHRLGHRAVVVHHIVGRQARELGRGPGGERGGTVGRPVGAFHVVVGAQEIMHALWAILHVGIGGPSGIIPLVMLARPGQSAQRAQAARSRQQAHIAIGRKRRSTPSAAHSPPRPPAPRSGGRSWSPRPG